MPALLFKVCVMVPMAMWTAVCLMAGKQDRVEVLGESYMR